MVRPRVYPDELRQRAVRLVREWQEARGVTDGGYTAISKQLGIRSETLRQWVLLDEPEAHLHLSAQRDVVQVAAELSASGAGAIVATYSLAFLNDRAGRSTVITVTRRDGETELSAPSGLSDLVRRAEALGVPPSAFASACRGVIAVKGINDLSMLRQYGGGRRSGRRACRRGRPPRQQRCPQLGRNRVSPCPPCADCGAPRPRPTVQAHRGIERQPQRVGRRGTGLGWPSMRPYRGSPRGRGASLRRLGHRVRRTGHRNPL